MGCGIYFPFSLHCLAHFLVGALLADRDYKARIDYAAALRLLEARAKFFFYTFLKKKKLFEKKFFVKEKSYSALAHDWTAHKSC